MPKTRILLLLLSIPLSITLNPTKLDLATLCRALSLPSYFSPLPSQHFLLPILSCLPTTSHGHRLLTTRPHEPIFIIRVINETRGVSVTVVVVVSPEVTPPVKCFVLYQNSAYAASGRENLCDQEYAYLGAPYMGEYGLSWHQNFLRRLRSYSILPARSSFS